MHFSLYVHMYKTSAVRIHTAEESLAANFPPRRSTHRLGILIGEYSIRPAEDSSAVRKFWEEYAPKA